MCLAYSRDSPIFLQLIVVASITYAQLCCISSRLLLVNEMLIFDKNPTFCEIITSILTSLHTAAAKKVKRSLHFIVSSKQNNNSVKKIENYLTLQNL